MAAGLPNVNQLVAQIHAKVAEHDAVLEKRANAPGPAPSFNTVAARNLFKLAHNLRLTAAQPLTYDDVRQFVRRAGG